MSCRMRILKTLSVLADLSSEDSSPHNLDPKYRSECLPYVIVIPRSGENRWPQIMSGPMFFHNIANITWAKFMFINFIHKNATVLQASIHQCWQLGPLQLLKLIGLYLIVHYPQASFL